MKTQKELKEKYMNTIKAEVWKNDTHMQEYARKECEYVVELSNGNIISIEKPRIQKDFCYGMGMYASYTDEEFEAAERLADKARTDVQYFIENNKKREIRWGYSTRNSFIHKCPPLKVRSQLFAVVGNYFLSLKTL